MLNVKSLETQQDLVLTKFNENKELLSEVESGMEEKALSADVGYMRKLVKPAALRAMMSAKLAQKLQADYVGLG